MTKRRNKQRDDRNHISLRHDVYVRLKAFSESNNISMSQLVETLLSDLPEVTK